MFTLIKRFWNWFKSPSKMAIGGLLFIGAAGGLGTWAAIETAVEHTNTEKFCSQCHLREAYPEYLQSAHYQTRTGVGASCPDCHVPHEFLPKWTRKFQAAGEVYAWFMGYTSTIEKFNALRPHMAEKEWKRMKANDSQECRNCHNAERMDWTKQKRVAANLHQAAFKEGKTCIDCHQGIAHKLPDMHGIKSGIQQVNPKDMPENESAAPVAKADESSAK